MAPECRLAHSTEVSTFICDQIRRNGSATVELCFFFLSLSSVCVVFPRAPSSPPGGAGPMWSDSWCPAGQMEAATPDTFRNLQWGQCDWLCCVHKGTKGTKCQTRHSFNIVLKSSCPFLPQRGPPESSALLPPPGEMM